MNNPKNHGLKPFNDHIEALEWADANADGPVCCIDAWCYGRMRIDMDGGWTTNFETTRS